MCARYNFLSGESREMLTIVRGIERQYGQEAWTQGDIRPTDRAPVLMQTSAGIRPRLLSWGFRTPKSLVINARCESAEERPLFRDCLRTGRCAVPSTGFYEWDGDNRKYIFHLPGEEVLYMAGLIRAQENGLSFCILTAPANPSVADIHDRMPLVLRREQVRSWLSPQVQPGEILRTAPPLLRCTRLDAQISLW